MGQTSAPHGAPSRTETWKCQGCGATNRTGAQWCGQCFDPATTTGPRPGSRTTAESPPESALAEPDEPAHTGAPQAYPTTLEDALLLLAKKSGGATTPATAARQPDTPDSGPEANEVDAGAFSVRAGEITWVCKWCEARNLLAEQSCSVCGAGFGEVLKEEKQQVARDPGTVALISLFLPGAGHVYMGDWGQGVARAVVSI